MFFRASLYIIFIFKPKEREKTLKFAKFSKKIQNFSALVELARKMLDSSIIFPDFEALIQIKKDSRKNYLMSFNQLRDFIGDELESRPLTKHELLQNLFDILERRKQWLHPVFEQSTDYSMINSVSRLHFNF